MHYTWVQTPRAGWKGERENLSGKRAGASYAIWCNILYSERHGIHGAASAPTAGENVGRAKRAERALRQALTVNTLECRRGAGCSRCCCLLPVKGVQSCCCYLRSLSLFNSYWTRETLRKDGQNERRGKSMEKRCSERDRMHLGRCTASNSRMRATHAEKLSWKYQLLFSPYVCIFYSQSLSSHLGLLTWKIKIKNFDSNVFVTGNEVRNKISPSLSLPFTL